MTLVVEVDGVALAEGALIMVGPNNDIPGGVQGLPLAAWYGEALTGGYVIDDPEGIYDFTGLHTIVAYETAATRPFISGGWITGRRIERGPYKSGPSRIHHVDFIDINWNFALMVFRASSAKRPAETDIARFAYIQASAPMAFTPSHDNGRFNVTDNPVNFDDSDLVTRYPIEAINEFAGIAGKNFYNYWDPDEEEISLHYDLVGVGPAAGLSISNDMADAGADVYYPYLDAELDQGPAYKVTGMLLGYRGAYAYGIRQATIDDLSPSVFSPDEFQRDEVYRTDRIGRLETANAQIVSMLDDRAEDTDTIKVTIEVPAAAVNDAYPGEIVPVTFTHLPGYETETELPVIRRNVVPKDGRTDTYLIHLELSGVGLPSGPGGGDPGGFPHNPPPCTTPTLVNAHASTNLGGSFTFTATAGNLLLLSLFARGDGGPSVTPPVGWSLLRYQSGENPPFFEDNIAVYGKISDGTESSITLVSGNYGSTTGRNWSIQEWSGIDLNNVSSDKNVGEGSTTLTGASIVSTGGGLVMGFFAQTQDTATTFAPGSGWTEIQEFNGFGTDHPHCGIIAQTATVATFTPVITSNKINGFCSITLLLQCTPSDNPPDSGEWVFNELVAMGDGTTLTFTTEFPFADGSLRVRYDTVDQTPQIDTYDGTTGDFTMTGAPIVGQQVFVDYQGR